MKIVDTREYVSVLKNLTEEGKEVSMTVAGSSMSPFLINGRDTVAFKKCDRTLRTGDIVFYQRANGQFIMHRICQIKPDGYYIVGDAQTMIEGPVKESQIFAIITRVKRKGKWIGPGNFWWEFFEHVWIHMIPVRTGVRAIYSIWYRLRERK